jgi:hypothetical protein
MQVVQLLPPESFSPNRFRVAARLPEAALPVCHRLGAQGLRKAWRSVLSTIITQPPARELAQISQRPPGTGVIWSAGIPARPSYGQMARFNVAGRMPALQMTPLPDFT